MKDKIFPIRFSKEQLAKIRKNAESQGFSNVASFIRYRALDNSIERKLDKLIKKIKNK